MGKALLCLFCERHAFSVAGLSDDEGPRGRQIYEVTETAFDNQNFHMGKLKTQKQGAPIL